MTPDPILTTEELIQRIKQGINQERCFQQLHALYAGRVTRFFQRKGLPPEDCRDLVQETFLSLFRGIKEFRQDAQFESWLFVIANNEFRSLLEARRAKKRAGRTLSLDQEMGDGQGDSYTLASTLPDRRLRADEIMIEQEKLQRLRAALRELPPQMGRCVQLRVICDLSYQQIAEEMGLALGTVKAHIHQAQKSLKEKLRPYFGEVEF